MIQREKLPAAIYRAIALGRSRTCNLFVKSVFYEPPKPAGARSRFVKRRFYEEFALSAPSVARAHGREVRRAKRVLSAAACCNLRQPAAVCCNLLQSAAACGNLLQSAAACGGGCSRLLCRGVSRVWGYAWVSELFLYYKLNKKGGRRLAVLDKKGHSKTLARVVSWFCYKQHLFHK